MPANVLLAIAVVVLLAGCGVGGVADEPPVGPAVVPTPTPDRAHELQVACIQGGGTWNSVATLERHVEEALEATPDYTPDLPNVSRAQPLESAIAARDENPYGRCVQPRN